MLKNALFALVMLAIGYLLGTNTGALSCEQMVKGAPLISATPQPGGWWVVNTSKIKVVFQVGDGVYSDDAKRRLIIRFLMYLSAANSDGRLTLTEFNRALDPLRGQASPPVGRLPLEQQ